MATIRKKRILLNWWYDRPDLMEPFRKLSDEIDFTCIFYKGPSHRELDLPFPCVFWGDFSSPQQLLAYIKPDEVVLFSVEDAPYQIGLNLACRALGIRTTLIDHGLRGFGKINAPKLVLDAKKPQSLLFLLRGAGIRNSQLGWKLSRLIGYKLAGSLRGRTDPELAILRRTDRYICYSPANARYFTERDGVEPGQICLTGVPAFDAFFRSKPETPTTEPYYLLIDQPLSRSRFNHALFSDADKRGFFRKLNQFCLLRNHRLYIKLHPDEYDLPELLPDPNIVYLRNCVIEPLIWQSAGVFGFYSTLLLPAIYAKSCVIFRVEEMPLQQEWEALGVVRLLSFFDFEPEDLHFEISTRTEENLTRFADLFLYKTDSCAQKRLAALLLPLQTNRKPALPLNTDETTGNES